MFAVKYIGYPVFFFSLLGIDLMFMFESYLEKKVLTQDIKEAFIKSLDKQNKDDR